MGATKRKKLLLGERVIWTDLERGGARPKKEPKNAMSYHPLDARPRAGGLRRLPRGAAEQVASETVIGDFADQDAAVNMEIDDVGQNGSKAPSGAGAESFRASKDVVP